jgi:hypothetical protein
MVIDYAKVNKGIDDRYLIVRYTLKTRESMEREGQTVESQSRHE